MGRIMFRRIGGRIVPILEKTASSHPLPEDVGKAVQNIRFMRNIRAVESTPTTAQAKFTQKIQAGFIKTSGKRTGAAVAAIVKRKK